MTDYHIGIDSTDSADLGMCTTYLGAVLLERLEELPLELIDYPALIRLNPNVPWKTRGNGAIAFHYTGPDELEERIFGICKEAIMDLSVMQDPQTNPGLIVLRGDVPHSFRGFYHDSLHLILDIKRAEETAFESDSLFKTWKNGRGLIGAIAAVGADLTEFTYECILYRPGHIKDRKRDVEIGPIIKASEENGSTFYNIDDDGSPLCIPNSPCPVILGIRGVDPVEARRAVLSIDAKNRERWALWRTNQHTDAHIEYVDSLEGVVPFSSISVEGVVSTKPKYADGGHLSFDLIDRNMETMVSWAYEPTKGFRKRLSGLRKDDRIRVWGSIREGSGPYSRGLNLEKVELIETTDIWEEFNPRCPECGGSTESMGKGQGLRCRSCGKRDGLSKMKRKVKRTLEVGMIEPPAVAWRHLFRPRDLVLPAENMLDKPFFGKF